MWRQPGAAMSKPDPTGFLPALQDFVYQPWTSWEGLCQGWFSPSITFGSNRQDRAIEAHVLDSVGSYGKQLSCIIGSMSVLVSRLDHGDLTPAEENAVYQFRTLAHEARKAVAEFREKVTAEDATLAAVDTWVDAIAALKDSNPAAYARLSSRIRDALPPLDKPK